MCKIKDVAREAGVSMATVSHVINDSRFVSDEAGARVMAAIERWSSPPFGTNPLIEGIANKGVRGSDDWAGHNEGTNF